jgi:hypothetical protein
MYKGQAMGRGKEGEEGEEGEEGRHKKGLASANMICAKRIAQTTLERRSGTTACRSCPTREVLF